LYKHHVELEALKAEYNELVEVTDTIVSLEYLISFDPTKLLKKAKRLQKLKDKLKVLQTAHTNVLQWEAAVQVLRQKESALKQRKEKMLEVCPLCGRS